MPDVVDVHGLLLAGIVCRADTEYEIDVVFGRGHRVALAEPFLAAHGLGGRDVVARPVGCRVGSAPGVEVDVAGPCHGIAIDIDRDVVGLELAYLILACDDTPHLAIDQETHLQGRLARRYREARAALCLGALWRRLATVEGIDELGVLRGRYGREARLLGPVMIAS